ncbi:hypothetical protein AB0B63_06910 [Micromonospora sp. NPDC049081]|uniref:hypothetical protein n=1 Tax=Micromonospora sp. NPDC049081 TaxID=3155150 RepID=UPI0033FFB181
MSGDETPSPAVGPVAGDVLAADLIAKVNAGTRLFYAIYMHPKGPELLKSEFATMGFFKAYNAACGAFLPRGM